MSWSSRLGEMARWFREQNNGPGTWLRIRSQARNAVFSTSVSLNSAEIEP